MPRSPLLALATAAAVALTPAAAGAAISAKPLATKRHPGGIVVRQERVTIDGRTSHVTTVTMPKPGRGRALEPYLPNDIVSAGTTTTSEITRQLDRYGTAVGINADLFEYASGQPSGLFMVDSEIYNQPQGGRPAMFIGVDGMLGMTTPKSAGVLRVGKRRIPFEVNVRRDDGVVLYDFGWGKTPPPGARRAVVGRITGFRVFQHPKEWVLTSELRVTRAAPGVLPTPPQGGDTFLFAAYGKAGAALAAVKRGAHVRMRWHMGPLPGETRHGVGGGPVLVEDGKVVYERSRYREFSDSQLVPPDARTAVAQKRDGTVIFYAVDQGPGSAGFTVEEVARDLARRGADRAMAFDSGGSTAVSVDGELLNKPSDGYERPIGNVLVYFRPEKGYRMPIESVRVGEVPPGKRVPRLTYALKGGVKTEVWLHDPRGAAYFVSERRRGKGTHRVRIPKRILRPGHWQLEIAVPDYQDRVIKDFTVLKTAAAADEQPAQADDAQPESVTESSAAATDDEDGGDGGSSTGWIAGGAAALLLAAAAAIAIARRRRAP
ncbi:MAG TPA: phosphodiester glycosidase family protein [Capillimicrobium sp.]|nr:phosphodiester glycosidase family protein [Capillimicrobium sp.]